MVCWTLPSVEILCLAFQKRNKSSETGIDLFISSHHLCPSGFSRKQMMDLGITRPRAGLPRRYSGKSACWCRRRCRRRGFDPWAGKIPWRRKWQPTPVFLPGKSTDFSLVGYSQWGHLTQLSDWAHKKRTDTELELEVKDLLESHNCER